MKVLHFYKTYYPDSYGGVEQVIYQLAENMSAQGVESHILSLSREPQRNYVKHDSHTVHTSSLTFEIASTGFSWKAIKKYAELASQADIIHFHFPWPFMDIVHLISNIKKPTIVSYHSDIIKQKHLLKLYKPLMYKFLEDADIIVASSPIYAKNSLTLNRYSQKTHIIPYGLNEHLYPTVNNKLRTELEQQLPQKFFLFIGALRYYKGLEYLLKAASINRLPVVIAGSGGIEHQLRILAKELNLSNVFFIGEISNEEKCTLLSLCTAFIFPSNQTSEAFGISLLEAAMFSKAMITCDIGTGTSYINIHEETGLVIPPSDAINLSCAMQTLWNNEGKTKKYGANARARFDALFTAEKMTNEYLNLYQKIAKAI